MSQGAHLSDQAEGIRVARRDGGPILPLKHGGGGDPRTTRTITVTSGKGGVGKTQISANLAVTLAQRGFKVVLLDADLGLASLDLALGLSPERDLMDVLRGRATMEDILVEGPSGVQLLPACPGRYEMANLGVRERRALGEMVRDITDRFDVLVIDTGAGIGSNAVEFAASADDVLLVATPDPTSMRDAYAMAKVLHRRSGVDAIQLVANQVSSDAEGALIHDRLDSIVRRFLALELGYLGCIPRDDSVQRGVATGQPFVIGAPRSTATRATEGIVRRLYPETAPRELC